MVGLDIEAEDGRLSQQTDLISSFASGAFRLLNSFQRGQGKFCSNANPLLYFTYLKHQQPPYIQDLVVQSFAYLVYV